MIDTKFILVLFFVPKVGSEPTIGGKRKRHQGISESVPDIGFGRESPAIKRYNFHRSTITKVLPNSSDGLQQSAIPKEDSSLDKNAGEVNLQVAESRRDTIEIVLQERADVIPTQNDGDVVGSETAERGGGGENEGNLEGQGVEIVLGMDNGGGEEAEVTGVEEEEIGDEAEAVEDGAENDVESAEFSEEVDADEGEGDGQVLDQVAQGTSRGSDSEEDAEDNVGEKGTLKQKWWDYLTT
ncbi:hypothetical protein L7F22_061685 [Adiantum nelumboides]|nr:hypothetical protein [Adiantum nelumboides]